MSSNRKSTQNVGVLENILTCHRWSHIDRVCYRTRSSKPLSGKARECVEQAIKAKTYDGLETIVIGGKEIDGEMVGGQMYVVYQTILVDGKAVSCNCPAHKPCKHMTQLEARETDRRQHNAREQCEVEEFQAWLAELDKDEQLVEWTRQELERNEKFPTVIGLDGHRRPMFDGDSETYTISVNGALVERNATPVVARGLVEYYSSHSANIIECVGSLGNNRYQMPTPLTQTPTPRKVSAEFLMRR